MADINKMSQSLPPLFDSSILCFTPNLCCSSIIAKPKFLNNAKRDCYRTYSMKKMSAVSVVSYKIEREFRNWEGRNSESEN